MDSLQHGELPTRPAIPCAAADDSGPTTSCSVKDAGALASRKVQPRKDGPCENWPRERWNPATPTAKSGSTPACSCSSGPVATGDGRDDRTERPIARGLCGC